MFTPKTFCAAAALCLLPLGAYAGSVEVTAGVQGNLFYDKDLDKTGDSIEGYVNAAIGNFYGEIWLGTLDDPTDEFEYELTLGYANDINDKLSYDASITGYYLNDSGYQNYYVTLDMTYAFSDSLSGTLELSGDPENDTTDHNLSLEYVLDKWTIVPTVGVIDGDTTYGELEFIYTLDNGVWFEADFYDDEVSSPAIGFYIGYDFTLMGS